MKTIEALPWPGRGINGWYISVWATLNNHWTFALWDKDMTTLCLEIGDRETNERIKLYPDQWLVLNDGKFEVLDNLDYIEKYWSKEIKIINPGLKIGEFLIAEFADMSDNELFLITAGIGKVRAQRGMAKGRKYEVSPSYKDQELTERSGMNKNNQND